MVRLSGETFKAEIQIGKNEQPYTTIDSRVVMEQDLGALRGLIGVLDGWRFKHASE
jgi:hypothetical protein